jgi:hypothetical protein
MIGDSNPSMGVSPPDAGDSDLFVIRFYDTDDPDNSKDDPTIESRYGLDDEELDELTERIGDHLDVSVESVSGIEMMLVDNEILKDILDGVTR